MRANNPYCGFTLNEVLVMGAIFIVLLAISLPLQLQLREDARRQQCQENLKRLGLALHTYHDTVKAFPPGWIAKTHPVPLQPNSQNWGWNALLLPYLNQKALYETVTVNGGWDRSWTTASAGSPISKVIQTPLPFLRCPSDEAPPTVAFGKGGNAWGGISMYLPSTGGPLGSGALTVARSNYAGVVGPNGKVVGPGLPSDIRHGAPGYGNGGRYPLENSAISGTFFQNSRRNFRDFTDGISNVILVGERRSPTTVRRGGVTHYTGGDTTWVGVPEMGGWSGYLLVGGDTGRPLNYVHPSPWSVLDADPAAGFSSAHRGGGYFLIGDGSVRFLSNDIATNPDHNGGVGGDFSSYTYQNLAAINNSGPISF